MENQHRKISNYRELSQEEIDLMNSIKELGSQLESKIGEVQNYLLDNVSTLAGEHTKASRSTVIATEHLQTGIMWLTRAVARPNNFG